MAMPLALAAPPAAFGSAAQPQGPTQGGVAPHAPHTHTSWEWEMGLSHGTHSHVCMLKAGRARADPLA